MLIDIVFDGPPGPEAGRFVEVEDQEGRSISVGEWVKRADGYWALRLEVVATDISPNSPTSPLRGLIENTRS